MIWSYKNKIELNNSTIILSSVVNDNIPVSADTAVY